MKDSRHRTRADATTRPGRPSDNIPRRKMSLQLPEILADRVQDYAYWEGVSVTQAIAQILIQHFKAHPVQTRPRPKDLRTELEKLPKQS